MSVSVKLSDMISIAFDPHEPVGCVVIGEAGSEWMSDRIRRVWDRDLSGGKASTSTSTSSTSDHRSNPSILPPSTNQNPSTPTKIRLRFSVFVTCTDYPGGCDGKKLRLSRFSTSMPWVEVVTLVTPGAPGVAAGFNACQPTFGHTTTTSKKQQERDFTTTKNQHLSESYSGWVHSSYCSTKRRKQRRRRSTLV